MTRDPILNSAMKKHPRGQVRVYDETGKRIAGTSCGGYLSEFEESRKPRTVTTAAELDGLPVGSVVLTAETWAATKTVYGWHYGDERVWFVEDHFPATVLFEGEK